MIDLVCIFTTGGIILFYQTFTNQISKVQIQKLIQNYLAAKKDQTSVQIDQFRIDYKKNQEKNLIFVIGTQEFLKIQHIDLLINQIEESYINEIYPEIKIEDHMIKNTPEYTQQFEQVVNNWSKKVKDLQKQEKTRTFYQTKAGKEALITTQLKNKKNQEEAKLQEENKAKEILENRLRLQKKYSSSNVKSQGSDEQLDSKQKSNKKSRISTSGKVDKRTMESLDMSSVKDKIHSQNEEEVKNQYFGGENDKIDGFVDDEYEYSDEDEKEQEDNKKGKKGFFSKISNKVSLFTGSKKIDEHDLEPVLLAFKDHLASKNVAEEMAQKICDSIKINLLNTKSQAFTSLSKMVKYALEDTLTKILTPKRHIDPIAEALRAKQKGKPYVIAFIGVNGVGKSTNLAKVAFMFKNLKFKVMLAACDNFRAGAVEQIKTHGRNLDIPVFDKGYGQDAAEIAFEAIREAQLKKYEVVLIDTAGRMQDNEPLMRQLSKLVVMNNPDLVVFIGEALVGNDGLDQLTKFNKALIDLSPRDKIREIDGVILSKFDTVDDKMGAAITMTYNSGKPILFVGVGQKYTHLQKLNIKTVVKALVD